MKRKWSLSLVVLALGSAAAAAEVADNCFERMPFGCFVTRSEVLSKDQTGAISGKLGTPIKKLSNTYLQVQGRPIQVNILEAGTTADAQRLHKTISAMKNHPAFCLIQDKKVVEFCNADVSAAVKTAFELGFTPKPRQVEYALTARIATVDKADYMLFNTLFNAFLQIKSQNPSKEQDALIRKLIRDVVFGPSVVLLKQPAPSAAYTFTPAPEKVTEQRPDRLSYSFTRAPELLGVPYVTLRAKITCNDRGVTPTDRTSDAALLSATPFWPVDDPQIQELSRSITKGRRTQEEKVEAILAWLRPGANIKPEGPAGSRWGVKKVLEQKCGHCWDASDCFVTLARAAGIPSRQVGGWLYGTSGHIWAEVLVPGKEWQQVDPTGGGKLACGIYHMPYFVTETGDMPILYLSMPDIEIAKTE